MPLFKDKWEVSEELLEELRTRFEDELKTGPEVSQLYHPEDIQRVRENDWFIARYILHKDRDIDQAFKMLKESLKFRNDMKVNCIKEEDIPPDYWESRCVIIYNKDNKDHALIVVRGKEHKKKIETRFLQQQYFLYWVEKAVRASDWGAVSVLFDLTDSGYQNLDLDMMRFMLQTFQKYYAWGICYFMVYNMPWYLSTIWKMVKQWIPEKHLGIICFVDSKSIMKYVEKDQLPVSMGGTCTDLYGRKEA